MKKNDRRKRKLQEEACDYEIERTPTTRYEPDYEEGLTSAQAEEHRRDGWGNISVDPPAQTTEEIIKENVFTYFNLIFLVLAILLIIVGSFRNLTFLPVIIFNTLIGIIQEIRSKKTLEKLNMLNAPHATVIRDGKTSRVNSESLVLDDIVIFKAGNQVCADAEVVHGSVQVNESLLTGESDEITKNPGDHLMSGSFIVAGECHARLDAVGVDSYISKLTLEAKAMQKGEQSEMIRSLDKLVKFVGIALIPIGIILFVQSFFFNGDPFRSSITSMVAAVIGMIPEGLYLLASVAMAVSAMRLAKQKVLLHDMKSIETLARVNVLCVDKTGTITETNMSVKDVVPTSNYKKDEMPELPKMLGDFAKAMSSDNITMEALKEYFKEGTGKKAESVTPFTSATKYSGVTYEEEVHVLGAPEFVLRDDFDKYKEEIDNVKKNLIRVDMLKKVEKLPYGMDTYLSKWFSKGTDFSGGETQRIAIARGLFRDAGILVMDEPNAAIDPIAEHIINQSVNQVSENKMVFNISHRLSMMRFCDHILVFDKGILLEDGSHDKLMKDGELYKQMFDLQARYYQ